jgi:phage head-tail adaptor, putative, SPP1 family
LIATGETKADDTKRAVIAKVESIGRDEFNSAGQNKMKARHKFVMWASEYQEEEVVIHNGKRFSVYRTYGPRDDERIELYAGERIGNT